MRGFMRESWNHNREEEDAEAEGETDRLSLQKNKP
jgi:hypothetical protein